MNKDELIKRVGKMKHDTYPLDKMLPIRTAFKIFQEEYNNKVKKSDFFDNRKYKRFREGYWGLFVCKALDKMEEKEHFIVFPSDDTNGDVNFLSKKDKGPGDMNKLVFDVKEYEEHSKDFDSFLNSAVIPKRNLGIYGIIVGLVKDVIGDPLTALATASDKDRGVFIVSAIKKDDYNNPYKSRVLYVYKGKILFDEEIDIETVFKEGDPIIIYQDTLRNM